MWSLDNLHGTSLGQLPIGYKKQSTQQMDIKEAHHFFT